MSYMEIIYTVELSAGQIGTLKYLAMKKLVSYKRERVTAQGLDIDRIDNNIRLLEDIIKSLEDATKDET